MSRPRLLITMGDVAGIGPEVIAGAWGSISAYADATVVGDPGWMRRLDPDDVYASTVRKLTKMQVPAKRAARRGGANASSPKASPAKATSAKASSSPDAPRTPFPLPTPL